MEFCGKNSENMTERNALTGIHCISIQRVQMERVSGFVWVQQKPAYKEQFPLHHFAHCTQGASVSGTLMEKTYTYCVVSLQLQSFMTSSLFLN